MHELDAAAAPATFISAASSRTRDLGRSARGNTALRRASWWTCAACHTHGKLKWRVQKIREDKRETKREIPLEM